MRECSEPQAVDEWSVEHTVSCGVRQKHILDCAMKMLKGGGYIVYSTCTFAPEENEQVCAYMLENYNVELVEPNNLDMLSKGRGVWSNSDCDMSKTRRIFPHKNNGEGHFVALFHSLDNYESEVSKPKKTSMTDAEKVYRQFEKEFLNTELDGEFCLFGEQLYLKPKCIDVDKIKVVRNGLNLGIYREDCRVGEIRMEKTNKRQIRFDLKKKILRIPLILNVTVKNLKSILWVIQSNVIKKVGVP